jgi:hypothetical protein
LYAKAGVAVLGIEVAWPANSEERNVELSSKLETMLVMGVKTAGLYDPMSALGKVEEEMTTNEAATAARFLNWIVANKLTFGRGNIRERFAQFDTAQ